MRRTFHTEVDRTQALMKTTRGESSRMEARREAEQGALEKGGVRARSTLDLSVLPRSDRTTSFFRHESPSSVDEIVARCVGGRRVRGRGCGDGTALFVMGRVFSLDGSALPNSETSLRVFRRRRDGIE